VHATATNSSMGYVYWGSDEWGVSVPSSSIRLLPAMNPYQGTSFPNQSYFH